MSGTGSSIKAFAARYPFLFALIYTLIVFAILVIFDFLAPGNGVGVGQLIELIVQAILAVGVLIWLGWLRDAGFNSPGHWHDLYVLWLPALITLLVLLPLFFVLPRVTNPALLAYVVLYALLTGLNEEAAFRGVVLQALRPYGPVAAALLSALLFGLVHLNNLIHTGGSVVAFASVVTLAQVVWAFLMGVGYAAFRLRTRTIWPLMLLHACSDLAIDVAIFATVKGAGTIPARGLLVAGTILITLDLIMAAYGLFLLRPLNRQWMKEKQAAQEPSAIPGITR
jgi:membrane protease YdiL (CAAX protease family)